MVKEIVHDPIKSEIATNKDVRDNTLGLEV